MRENDENWQSQLDTVINEIVGLNEILLGSHFLILLSKLFNVSIDYLLGNENMEEKVPNILTEL